MPRQAPRPRDGHSHRRPRHPLTHFLSGDPPDLTSHVNGVTCRVALCVRRPSRASCVRGRPMLWRGPVPPPFPGRATPPTPAVVKSWKRNPGVGGPRVFTHHPSRDVGPRRVTRAAAHSLGHVSPVLRGTGLGAGCAGTPRRLLEDPTLLDPAPVVRVSVRVLPAAMPGERPHVGPRRCRCLPCRLVRRGRSRRHSRFDVFLGFSFAFRFR